MDCSAEEYRLLAGLALQLKQQLGSLVVYVFTASFTSVGPWVARMDYTREGEVPSKDMKSILIEGQGDSIWSTTLMRPRIFRERPSIAILRQDLVDLYFEGPGLEVRYV